MWGEQRKPGAAVKALSEPGLGQAGWKVQEGGWKSAH